MALNLAEQFSRNAEQGLPEWQAYEDMLADRAVAANPIQKPDVNNLEDLSDEELNGRPELLAIKKARERELIAQLDKLEDSEKERKEKQEADARHDDVRNAMEEAAEAAGKRWDNEISDLGNLGLSNKELLDRLHYISKYKDQFREQMENEGILQKGHKPEYDAKLDEITEIQERKRRRAENCAGRKQTHQEAVAENADNAAQKEIIKDPVVGPAIAATIERASEYGLSLKATEDNKNTYTSVGVQGTSTHDLNDNFMTELSVSIPAVPEKKADLPAIQRERTFETNANPTREFAEVASNKLPATPSSPLPIIAPVATAEARQIMAATNF